MTKDRPATTRDLDNLFERIKLALDLQAEKITSNLENIISETANEILYAVHDRFDAVENRLDRIEDRLDRHLAV